LEPTPTRKIPQSELIPATLKRPGAGPFWLAVVLTGIATGLGAAALTKFLELAQHLAWNGSGADILDVARHANASRHIAVLLGAGVMTGAGQLILRQLSSGNGIDTTAAIWFHAGRMPRLRTLGSAVLSVIIVGMGVSLGREGAPKQAGAVFANLFADRGRLSNEQRRLLVACGAGAGLGSAYGVPLGGALFAIEVMRGKLALRYVLPALFASMIATAVSWLWLPDKPTYVIPHYSSSVAVLVWACLAGAIAGFVSVWYVRMVTWADRNRAKGWERLAAPVLVMGLFGLVSIRFPQLLGNGKDVSQLALTSAVAPVLLAELLLLKPAAILFSMRSGAPGGLFTPSLTTGAMLGGVLGYLWSLLWPGTPLGLFSLLGAGAMLAATTQGPISTVVLMMELTGRDRSFILPLLLVVGIATMIARTIEPRSIYDAKLTDEELAERQRLRDLPPEEAAREKK
jgi:CIC family chloride channel protein